MSIRGSSVRRIRFDFSAGELRPGPRGNDLDRFEGAQAITCGSYRRVRSQWHHFPRAPLRQYDELGRDAHLARPKTKRYGQGDRNKTMTTRPNTLPRRRLAR
jgi:hypothetical protein